MVVITLSDCPSRVRGDITKWLCEISTGVYVGNLSARVRQELWNRICGNLKNGRATMVYSTQGEQQLAFEVHNSLWKPVDLDGIKLMRRPLPGKRLDGDAEEPHRSRAGKMLDARRAQAARHMALREYVIFDTETSGLSPENDRITEIAAIRIKDGGISDEFCTLIKQDIVLSPEITDMTGITAEMLSFEGIPIKEALEKLTAFVGSSPTVMHNAGFDSRFLILEARRCGVELFRNRCIDTLQIAKKLVYGVNQYTLTALCEYFGIDIRGAHRALTDCRLTYELIGKLNEIR